MTTLAIDRFREQGLSPDLEARAQEVAREIRWADDPNLLCGYLSQSIAIALERPRWASHDRLAIDLRVVDIIRGRRTP